MEKKTVDVIIPVYRPGKEFGELLRRLEKQEHRPEKILVMNTGRENWNAEWEKCPILEVHHLEQKDFDHGGTRKAGAALSDADILVFMTQDALPADKKLIGNLIRPLEEEKTGAAYARQLPKEDCPLSGMLYPQFQLSVRIPYTDCCGYSFLWDQDILLFQCVCGL